MLPTVVVLAPQTPGISDRLRHLEQLARTVGEVRFTHVDVDLPLEQIIAACGNTRVILLALSTAQIVPLAARLP